MMLARKKPDLLSSAAPTVDVDDLKRQENAARLKFEEIERALALLNQRRANLPPGTTREDLKKCLREIADVEADRELAEAELKRCAEARAEAEREARNEAWHREKLRLERDLEELIGKAGDEYDAPLRCAVNFVAAVMRNSLSIAQSNKMRPPEAKPLLNFEQRMRWRHASPGRRAFYPAPLWESFEAPALRPEDDIFRVPGTSAPSVPDWRRR